MWVNCSMLNFVSGRDLLVHPVTEEGARGVTAYLPGSGEVCRVLSAKSFKITDLQWLEFVIIWPDLALKLCLKHVLYRVFSFLRYLLYYLIFLPLQVWYDVNTFQKHSGAQNLYIPVTMSSVCVFSLYSKWIRFFFVCVCVNKCLITCKLCFCLA